MVPGPVTPQQEATMSVTRFEPYRDPFRELDRLISMATSGTRAPLGMPMDVYRAQDGVTMSRPTCPAPAPTASR